MQQEASETEKIKVGSIMQIVPRYKDNVPVGAGELLVVTEVESWGVIGYLPNGSIVRRAWNYVEPTGGFAVFDRQGNRQADAPARKHHP